MSSPENGYQPTEEELAQAYASMSKEQLASSTEQAQVFRAGRSDAKKNASKVEVVGDNNTIAVDKSSIATGESQSAVGSGIVQEKRGKTEWTEELTKELIACKTTEERKAFAEKYGLKVKTVTDRQGRILKGLKGDKPIEETMDIAEKSAKIDGHDRTSSTRNIGRQSHSWGQLYASGGSSIATEGSQSAAGNEITQIMTDEKGDTTVEPGPETPGPNEPESTPEIPDIEPTPEHPQEPDVEPTPENPDEPEIAEITEITEPQELVDSRRKYMEMLKGLQQKRWWKRPSDAEQEEIWHQYEGAFLKYALTSSKAKVSAEFSELTGGEREEKIREEIIRLKVEEMLKLSAVAAELATDGGRWEKCKQWWQKHKWARLGIGLGLTGAAVASGVGGFMLPSLAFAIARGGVAGVGTAFASESVMDMGQGFLGKRRGDTKRFSPEEILGLDAREINRALAAQLAIAIEKGEDMTENPDIKRLVDELTAQYMEKEKSAIAEYKEMGNTDLEIRTKLLETRQDDENVARINANKRRGNTALGKRIGAVVAGTAIGYFVGSHFYHPGGDGPSPEGPKPGSGEKWKNLFHGRNDWDRSKQIVDQYEQHTGTNLTPHQEFRARAWLWDRMWGAGVRHGQEAGLGERVSIPEGMARHAAKFAQSDSPLKSFIPARYR